MDGNKSGCLEERWRLLRHLHEGHGIELDALSLLTGIELTRLMERSISEGWDISAGCGVSRDQSGYWQFGKQAHLLDPGGEAEMVRHTRQAKLKPLRGRHRDKLLAKPWRQPSQRFCVLSWIPFVVPLLPTPS